VPHDFTVQAVPETGLDAQKSVVTGLVGWRIKSVGQRNGETMGDLPMVFQHIISKIKTDDFFFGIFLW
jgi:hypothetical protein